MTTGAIRNQFLLHELPVMIILVAIGAFVMFYRGVDIGSMACCTRHTQVFIFQLEICFGMIEIIVALNDEK